MMSNKRVWHVISPADPVNEVNGSAVQNVARRLISAAPAATEGVLVAGEAAPDESGVEPILAPTSMKSQLRDYLARYVPRLFSSSQAVRFSEARSLPDAVVLHNQHSLVPIFRAQLPRVPLIVYAHNRIFQRGSSFVARKLLEDADGLVTVSQDLATAIEDRLGRLSMPVKVIHSGVDGSQSKSIDEAWEWDVIFVGRVIPVKGVHVLIDALVELSRRGVFPRTLIVGSSWFYGHSEPEAYELSLRDRARDSQLSVEFKSAVPPSAVSGLLNSSRIAVVPSTWREPLGLTVLEGMASRSALVYSGVGGIPEVAAGGGMQVRPGNATELAAVIEILLEDEVLRHSVAVAGRRRASERTWDRAAAELDSFIEGLL